MHIDEGDTPCDAMYGTTVSTNQKVASCTTETLQEFLEDGDYCYQTVFE